MGVPSIQSGWCALLSSSELCPFRPPPPVNSFGRAFPVCHPLQRMLNLSRKVMSRGYLFIWVEKQMTSEVCRLLSFPWGRDGGPGRPLSWKGFFACSHIPTLALSLMEPFFPFRESTPLVSLFWVQCVLVGRCDLCALASQLLPSLSPHVAGHGHF